jgi:hypothetical protein
MFGEWPEQRAAKAPFAPKKKDKSPAKPRKKTEARCVVGFWPSRFSVKLGPALRLAGGSEKKLQPTNSPPSLDAQYRGLWKTCQEKLIEKPQNPMVAVSKASTCSGRHAQGHMGQIRAKSELRYAKTFFRKTFRYGGGWNFRPIMKCARKCSAKRAGLRASPVLRKATLAN